jgi:glutathione synthase/RimK-type ligase-like ATP-grasp enzyme
LKKEKLKSIYYRAPTFLRDIFQNSLSEEEQLYRTQWAAFVRSLIIFENIKWVNNPVATYKAEIKPMQLFYANKVGFRVPETLVTNVTKKSPGKTFAIKSIDTAIIAREDEEAFIYTSIQAGENLEDNAYASPFFLQEGLTPKVDVRITVIDKDVIAVKLKNKDGIDGDWRIYDGNITYELFELPKEIKDKCLMFTQLFDLSFAAIDMVICNDQYFFIEVNPTGEWSWLQKHTGFEFDSLIANSLCNEIIR